MYCNEAFCKTSGYNRAEVSSFINISTTLPSSDKSLLQFQLVKILAQNPGLVKAETNIILRFLAKAKSKKATEKKRTGEKKLKSFHK